MTSIFTDTSANLPHAIVKKYQITVIPFSYCINGTEYTPHSGKFDGEKYYELLREGNVVTTSMINTATFTEYFENELKNGNDILYLGMSGGVSGAAHAASLAAEELKESYPDRRIETIDTLGASLGEGLLVLEAAAMLKHGADLDRICEHVRNRIGHMCQCFTVEDLNYLRRTGRISGTSALIGGLLGIRPLLIGNDEGKIVMQDKIRGKLKVLDALADRYEKFVTDKHEKIGIAHADNLEGASYLLKKLKEKGFCGDSFTVCYEPVTGAHVGPGTIALFFFGKSRTE